MLWVPNQFQPNHAALFAAAAAPAGNIVFVVAETGHSVDGSGFGIGFPDTTGCDFFVLAVCDANASPRVISDFQGNTYNGMTTDLVFNASATRLRLYWSIPTTLTTSAHIIDTGESNFASGAFAGFSGVNASPVDVEASGSGTGTTASAGSGITPTQGSELIIAAVGLGSTGVAPTAIDSGFTIVGSVSSDGATHYGVAIAYKIQTSAAAVNPNWTLDGSCAWGAIIASFKAA